MICVFCQLDRDALGVGSLPSDYDSTTMLLLLPSIFASSANYSILSCYPCSIPLITRCAHGTTTRSHSLLLHVPAVYLFANRVCFCPHVSYTATRKLNFLQTLVKTLDIRLEVSIAVNSLPISNRQGKWCKWSLHMR